MRSLITKFHQFRSFSIALLLMRQAPLMLFYNLTLLSNSAPFKHSFLLGFFIITLHPYFTILILRSFLRSLPYYLYFYAPLLLRSFSKPPIFSGLPEMLLRQYEYEDPIVRGGKHLLHSAFFKELVALACHLGLDSLPCCSETYKWAWFRRYCMAARVANSLIKRVNLPASFCVEVRKKIIGNVYIA